MIKIQKHQEIETALEKSARDVKEKFRIKSKGFSFDSVRSFIANKIGDPLNTAYYDYLSIMSGKTTAEEVAEEYYKKAQNLGIL